MSIPDQVARLITEDPDVLNEVDIPDYYEEPEAIASGHAVDGTFTFYKGRSVTNQPFIPGYVSTDVDQAAWYAIQNIRDGKSSKIYKVVVSGLHPDNKNLVGMFDHNRAIIASPKPGVFNQDLGEAIIKILVRPIEVDSNEFLRLVGDESNYRINPDSLSDIDDLDQYIRILYPDKFEQIMAKLIKLGIVEEI